jgi:hypothetical protein
MLRHTAQDAAVSCESLWVAGKCNAPAIVALRREEDARPQLRRTCARYLVAGRRTSPSPDGGPSPSEEAIGCQALSVSPSSTTALRRRPALWILRRTRETTIHDSCRSSYRCFVLKRTRKLKVRFLLSTVHVQRLLSAALLLGGGSQQIGACTAYAPVRLCRTRQACEAGFFEETAALIVGRKL